MVYGLIQECNFLEENFNNDCDADSLNILKSEIHQLIYDKIIDCDVINEWHYAATYLDPCYDFSYTPCPDTAKALAKGLITKLASNDEHLPVMLVSQNPDDKK